MLKPPGKSHRRTRVPGDWESEVSWATQSRRPQCREDHQSGLCSQRASSQRPVQRPRTELPSSIWSFIALPRAYQPKPKKSGQPRHTKSPALASKDSKGPLSSKMATPSTARVAEQAVLICHLPAATQLQAVTTIACREAMKAALEPVVPMA